MRDKFEVEKIVIANLKERGNTTFSASSALSRSLCNTAPDQYQSRMVRRVSENFVGQLQNVFHAVSTRDAKGILMIEFFRKS